MRIALFNTMSPFIYGGAEALVDNLYVELQKRGHDVTLFRIPWLDDYMRLPLLVQAVKLLKFDAYDRVIVFKFPTFSVIHKNKVLWMCHQFRQVYDLWNKEYGLSEKFMDHKAIKEVITLIDNNDIGSSKHIFTIGDETSRRLRVYNNINSEVIYPPVNELEKYYFESVGDYLYYPSRITSLKRQLLSIEALRYTKTNVKLVISGSCEQIDYLEKINEAAKNPKIAKSLKFINKWITDEEKCRFMANSLGCIFIPYNEDYGYITLEAFLSKKPVITCTDSGGPVYFVKEGKNGYVADPDPKSIAQAMDKLYNDRKLAEEMGNNGFKCITDLNITWDETIRRLLLCE